MAAWQKSLFTSVNTGLLVAAKVRRDRRILKDFKQRFDIKNASEVYIECVYLIIILRRVGAGKKSNQSKLTLLRTVPVTASDIHYTRHTHIRNTNKLKCVLYLSYEKIVKVQCMHDCWFPRISKKLEVELTVKSKTLQRRYQIKGCDRRTDTHTDTQIGLI